MVKIKLKRSHKLFIVLLFVIFCLIGIIYSSINIIFWKKDIDSNQNIKKEIEKSVIINQNEDEKEQEKYSINWEELEKQNSDTIAYLKVNNTDINYVVVKGEDNSYYLNHNYNKEYNVAGWVFADYRNKFNKNDKNIIIYGHNMKDNSMFGSLKNILDESWYTNEENLIIDLVTEDGLRKYQVFSIYEIVKEDYYISTDFNNNDEYLNFLKIIKSRSIKDFNVELNSDSQILTLSTCKTGGIERVVLHAKLIN